MKTALITGASSGIGKEFTTIFSEKGYNLIIASRNIKALNVIADDCESKFQNKVDVIEIDLSKVGAAQGLYNQINAKGIQVDVLINNAGFGKHGLVVESDPSIYSNMIDLNINTLTQLSTLYVTEMKQRNSGRILNVASTAGYQPMPKLAVYSATKAYVLNFTEALHYELRDTAVSITALCPGATSTGFAKVANMDGNKHFKRNAMSPKRVAEAGYKGLMKNKMTVIPGFKNCILAFLSNAMPSRKLPLFVSNRLT